MTTTTRGAPPAFPRAAPKLPDLSARLQAMGAGFRRAGAGDLDFLRTLHHSFREAEMRLVPWTAAQKLVFLDDQFRLQHLHFVTHYPRADFLVAERTGPVGRLYLDRSTPMWRVIDIGFLPQARGAGLGSAVLRWAMESSTAAGAAGVDLHVAAPNPRARALYARLGFIAEGAQEGTHQRMVWRPS